MSVRHSLVVIACALLAGDAAAAQERWGVSDAETATQLEQELDAILAAPASRDDSRMALEPGEAERRMMIGDPELAEAYRSDPRKTLALIARIRAAGGNLE